MGHVQTTGSSSRLPSDRPRQRHCRLQPRNGRLPAVTFPYCRTPREGALSHMVADAAAVTVHLDLLFTHTHTAQQAADAATVSSWGTPPMPGMGSPTASHW